MSKLIKGLKLTVIPSDGYQVGHLAAYSFEVAEEIRRRTPDSVSPEVALLAVLDLADDELSTIAFMRRGTVEENEQAMRTIASRALEQVRKQKAEIKDKS